MYLFYLHVCKGAQRFGSTAAAGLARLLLNYRALLAKRACFASGEAYLLDAVVR